MFQKCSKCSAIIDDPDGKLSRTAAANPCCGETGIGARRIFPPATALLWLRFIDQLDTKRRDEFFAAVVFLCTVAEILLERELWLLLRGKHRCSDVAANDLLEARQGRERRVALYNKLTGIKMGDLLTSEGFPTFLSQWNKLAKVRNSIVHQGGRRDDADTRTAFREVRSNLVRVFAVLHNAAIGLSPAAPILI